MLVFYNGVDKWIHNSSKISRSHVKNSSCWAIFPICIYIMYCLLPIAYRLTVSLWCWCGLWQIDQGYKNAWIFLPHKNISMLMSEMMNFRELSLRQQCIYDQFPSEYLIFCHFQYVRHVSFYIFTLSVFTPYK